MTGLSTQKRAGHAGLVLPPLFLTMVFCFALVLVQQHQASERTTAAAAKQTYSERKSHSKLSPSELKAATTLTPVVVTPPSAATASTANPKVSAPPQPSKTSGSAVQSAAPNSQPSSTVYKVAKPIKQTLKNNLPH